MTGCMTSESSNSISPHHRLAVMTVMSKIGAVLDGHKIGHHGGKKQFSDEKFWENIVSALRYCIAHDIRPALILMKSLQRFFYQHVPPDLRNLVGKDMRWVDHRKGMKDADDLEVMTTAIENGCPAFTNDKFRDWNHRFGSIHPELDEQFKTSNPCKGFHFLFPVENLPRNILWYTRKTKVGTSSTVVEQNAACLAVVTPDRDSGTAARRSDVPALSRWQFPSPW